MSRDDARALACITAHGRTGIAFQALGRGLAHWFDAPGNRSGDLRGGSHGDSRGLVAYFDTGSAWIAAGEPIASREDSIPVAEAFVKAARAQGRRVAFFATEGVLAASPRLRRVSIGEQPVWDPSRWASDLRQHRSMREQLRRARAKGVLVREIEAGGSSLRAPIETLIERWRASRSMPVMRFLVDLAPFEHSAERRLFVAERHGTVQGMLSLSPVPARGGWLFEHLLRDPGAPNGTAELLVDCAMRALDADGVRWVTLGLAPLSGRVNAWLDLARRVSRPFFNFAGLSSFKRKLRPHAWEPMYMAFPREQHAAMAMLEALRAFAGGSVVWFGVRTVLRGPPPLLRALAWLLVPWTLLLALVPTHPWFPSRGVQAAWVVFDGLLLWALFRQQRLRSDWLAARSAVAIATAVSVDAVLTLTQAVWWNAMHMNGALETVAVVIACAGPAIAAPVLWGAVRRLQHLAGVRVPQR